MSFCNVRRTTSPVSLKIVGQGESAEQGAGCVTIVMTSDSSVFSLTAPELEPLLAVNWSMTRKTGDDPCRTTSPHETLTATTARALKSFLKSPMAVMFVSALGDSRRNEDEQLRVFVAHRVAPEQPFEKGNVAQTRCAIVVVVIFAGVNPANHGRLTVVDEDCRGGALGADRRR